MNIALCEDDPLQRQLLVACIDDWARRRSAQAVSKPHVQQYADANSFFFHYEEQGTLDLLFLDIDLSGGIGRVESDPYGTEQVQGSTRRADSSTRHLSNDTRRAGNGANEDGLRIARKVREKDPRVVIVFVTNNTGHVFQGYKVQAFDFLPKPVRAQEVERILDYTNRRLKNTIDQSFLIDTSLGMKKVMLEDIYYFEAQRHFVELYGTHGTETFRARFQDIVAELSPRDFLCPHRSFLVNMAHIQQLSKNSIIMTDGREIPLARNRQKDITGAWLGYFGGAAHTAFGASASQAFSGSAPLNSSGSAPQNSSGQP